MTFARVPVGLAEYYSQNIAGGEVKKRRFREAKYKCCYCGEKRFGGYEVVKAAKRWVCNSCFTEVYSLEEEK